MVLLNNMSHGALQYQPWEFAAAFGNAVVNAVLYWFYDGKKNAVVKDFTSVVFIATKL